MNVSKPFRPTILRSIVQSVIPAEKKKKVCAIEEPASSCG